MNLVVRVVTTVLYGLTAAIFIAAGGIIVFVNTGVLPTALRAAVLEESQGNLETLHVAQELGSMLVFGGLITLWFIPRYEQSQFFHWSLTGLWALVAAVHWFDVRDASFDPTGSLTIAAPMILFASVGVARWAFQTSGTLTEKRTA